MCIRRQRCREKTERGNVYKTEREAIVAARSMRRLKRVYIMHFKCQCCPCWHIGTESKELRHRIVEGYASA